MKRATVGAARPFVAGAFIEGQPGEPASLYRLAVDRDSGARRHADYLSMLGAFAEPRSRRPGRLSRGSDEAGGPLLAFELGSMFAPFGRIYSNDFFRRLIQIDAFTGLKHSSLDRATEWARLRIRDEHRPDFRVYTGNDLAIDMVFYGSDYLLGLSAFFVEAFAERDRRWAASDPRALTLNDLLQYMGQLAFRAPVPAYKHSAAQFSETPRIDRDRSTASAEPAAPGLGSRAAGRHPPAPGRRNGDAGEPGAK